MRTKTRGGRRKRRRPSTRPSATTTTQEEYSATESATPHESDDDLRDIPVAGSVDQHCDGILHHDSNHESIDLTDKSICVFCKKGDGLLVCCESGCSVALHAKCNCFEPKFDDTGNFYCPECWYKRAVNKKLELKKKVAISRKALLSFLGKDLVTNGELVQAERVSLGGDDGKGNDDVDVDIQLSQQPRKLRKAESEQSEIAPEGQADADGGCRLCREEDIPVDLDQDSMNWGKFDKPYKSETDDSICNKEDVLKVIGEDGEESEPLCSSHLGKHNDEHSPDIEFVKETQESVANSTDKGKMPCGGEKVSSSSVSETNDSDSDVISGRKHRGKRKVQKNVYPQNVASVRKSLLQEHNTKGAKASDINEDVTSSITRRQSPRLQKPVKNSTSLSLTFRRNKLLWTAEEETILEEGVFRFSKENQTIPWRRILEFGRHVFHKTRTPVDLRDKWRNILSREGCK